MTTHWPNFYRWLFKKSKWCQEKKMFEINGSFFDHPIFVKPGINDPIFDLAAREIKDEINKKLAEHYPEI